MVYPQLAGRQLTKKQRTAACSENQDKLDRLLAHYEKANPQSQYIQTLLRAIKSFAAHPLPIQTQKQALELKCVGNHIAKIICPDDENVGGVNDAKDNNNNNSEPPQSQATTTSALTTSNQSDTNTNTKTIATTKAKQPRKRKLPNAEEDGGGKVAATAGAAATAKQKAYDDAVKSAENLTLPQSGWKVLLLVDGRERRSDHVVAKCRMSGIPCEERHLPIGDMAWIARCEKHNNNLEIMLGTIIERKTAEDLTSSLFGTRYLEQRLRLQHCGIPQVLLLVEGDVNTVVNCPADTLEMAMMETRIQLDFQIVQTKTLDDTVRLLKRVHRRVLQRSFPFDFDEDQYANPQYLPTFASPTAAPRGAAAATATGAGQQQRRQRRPSSLMEMLMDTPPVPSLGATRFITYHELKCKIERDREAGTRTIGHVHAAMLKQVPSLSQKKAIAMAQAFPTPHALMTALEQTTNGDEAKQMLSSIVVDAQATRASTVGQKSADELIVAYCTTRQGNGVVASCSSGDGGGKPKAARGASSKSSSPSSQKAPPRATKKQEPANESRNVARIPQADDDSSVAMSLPGSLPYSSQVTAGHCTTGTASEDTLARLESLLSSTKDLFSSQDSRPAHPPPAKAPARAKTVIDDCVDLTQADESVIDDDDDDDEEDDVDDQYRYIPPAAPSTRTVSLSQDSVSVDGTRSCTAQLQPLQPRQNASASTRPTRLEKKSSIVSMHSTDMENTTVDRRRTKTAHSLLSTAASSSQNSCEVIEID